MQSRNFTIKKLLIHTFSVLTLLLLSSTFSKVYAQICPANFNGSFTPTQDSLVSSSKDENVEWTDLDEKDYNFSYSGPWHAGPVRWSITTKLWTQVFTKIFLNYASIVPAFSVSADPVAQSYLGDSEQYKKWQRFYCISGLDDTRVGQISLNVHGNYYDEHYKKKEVPCPSPNPFDPTQVCYDKELETQRDPVMTGPSVKEINVPYYAGLREIAKKVSTIVKDQYCNANDDCINQNYYCDANRVPPTNDPAGIGKSGTCSLNIEGNPELNDPSKKIVDILCTDVVTPTKNTPTTNLSSNICIYSQAIEYTTSNPDELPRLETATIDNGDATNSLPFDIDLFTNRNESTNIECATGGPSCVIDGFFRRALINKLSILNPLDISKMENFSEKVTAALHLESNQVTTSVGGQWIFDFIEKIGSIEFWSEEARFLDTSLEPAGFYSMNDGLYESHLRLYNAQRGILFVNGYPVGIRQFIDKDNNVIDPIGTQSAPFLSERSGGSGYTVSTVVADQNNLKAPSRMFVSINNNSREPNNLREVPNAPDSVVYQYPYYSFMNHRGDVIVMAFVNSAYYYSIYNIDQGKFGEWNILLGDNILPLRATIDNFDNLHLLFFDGPGSNVIHYEKISFSDPYISRINTLTKKDIIFPRGVDDYFGFFFNFTVDTKNIVHVVASLPISPDPVGKSWAENDIFYTAILPSGEILNPEMAISADKDYQEGYMPSDRSSKDTWISHQLSQRSSSVAVTYDNLGRQHIFIGYNNRSSGIDWGGSDQAAYAHKIEGETWIQNIKLSDRILDKLGHISNINIDKYGNVNFTVEDKGSKYFNRQRKFDASGYKMCQFNEVGNNIFSFGIKNSQSIKCAYNREDVGYVIAPSNGAHNRDSNGQYYPANNISGSNFYIEYNVPRLPSYVKTDL